MPDPDVIGILAQFGAAGLMAWMWLSERRAAAVREQQVSEAHTRIMDQKGELDVLVRALESNTRAMTALEVGQRHMIELLELAMDHGRPAGPPAPNRREGRCRVVTPSLSPGPESRQPRIRWAMRTLCL
jgi:hypothetical protein